MISGLLISGLLISGQLIVTASGRAA
jgi:hypothetical protein